MQDRSIGGISLYGVGFESETLAKERIDNPKFKISLLNSNNTINMCNASTDESFTLNHDSDKHSICLKYNNSGKSQYIFCLDRNDKIAKMMTEHKAVLSRWSTGRLNVEIVNDPASDSNLKIIINTAKGASAFYPLIEHISKLEACHFYFDSMSDEVKQVLKYKVQENRIWPLQDLTSD
jgi:hypothetical protein